ncbi:MAG TPA: DNA polymerase III subunit delta [Myxococcaceae bacterium]|nr:DNA polymerase III subunit delta [Myxococcaceae bacterium]
MSDALTSALEAIGKGQVLPLYLVWGEEFLIRKDAEKLSAALLPDAMAGLNLITMDGASPSEVTQELSTLPMFPGRKLVIVRDPEFLAPKKGRQDAMGRIRDAWRAGRRKEASRRLLALASRAGWGLSALEPGSAGAPSAADWEKELDVVLEEGDAQLFADIAGYCRQEGISAPEADATSLVELLKSNLPSGHMLLLVATAVDARHPLVKLAKDGGGLIERKVEAKLDKLDLSELAADVLKPMGKRMSPKALEVLKDRCGGNMRRVQSELEKLGLYAEAPVIEVADVELLVERGREEEYFELSEALQKRDLKASLQYAHDAFRNEIHGLQLLGSIASVVRRMLLQYGQLERFAGGRLPGSYNTFKDRVWPDIEADAKARKAKAGHPYAAFMSMQAAARHGRDSLLRSLSACADADVALKSSGDQLLVIERLLWTVCGAA